MRPRGVPPLALSPPPVDVQLPARPPEYYETSPCHLQVVSLVRVQERRRLTLRPDLSIEIAKELIPMVPFILAGLDTRNRHIDSR